MSNVVPETPVNPEEVAQEMVLAIRQLTRRMDGFGFLPANLRRRVIAVAATVPDEFFFVVADACDGLPRLAAASEFTGAQARNALAFERAFESVVREGELMVRGVLDTVAAFKATVSRGCLRVYETAKRMNASDENELLVPHIEKMRVALGRVGPSLTDDEKAELRATRAIVKAARAVHAAKAAEAKAIEGARVIEAQKAIEAPKTVEAPKVQS